MLILPFDHNPFLEQDGANPFAQVSLELDGPVHYGAARAAGPLEVLAELLQKCVVLRETIDDADGLSATPCLLDSQLGHDARGDGLGGACPAAAALADRPATLRTHPARITRVNDPRAITIRHPAIISHASAPTPALVGPSTCVVIRVEAHMFTPMSRRGSGSQEPRNNTDAHGSGSVYRPAEAGPFGPRLDESATRALGGSQRGGRCLSAAMSRAGLIDLYEP